MKRKALPVAIAALLMQAAYSARPHDPFILRAALRNKPRMVLIALDSGLTVAYDAKTCGLYEAWRGGVQDAADSYNHQSNGNHGATYYPMGKIIFKQSPEGEISETAPVENRPHTVSPPNESLIAGWSASRGGQTLPLAADYRGYTVDNASETATLRYRLNAGSADPIQVTEVPEVVKTSGAPTLIRDITLTGVSSGTKVSLLLSGNPIRKSDGQLLAEDWSATGDGRIEKLNGKAYFVAEWNGKTRITGTWR